MAITALKGENLQPRREAPCHPVSIAERALPSRRVQVRPIQVLLPARGPAAILGAVCPVVVDAVQRRARGSLTHVLKEDLERVPTAAHRNPAPSVMVVRDRPGIRASLAHAIPRVVGRGVLPCGASMAVLPVALTAAARTRLAVLEIGPTGFGHLPAGTRTDPEHLSLLPFTAMQHGQLSEDAAGQINQSHTEIVPYPCRVLACVGR